MIRRALAVAFVLATAAMSASPALAADRTATVSPVSDSVWPDRSYVVTLPAGAALSADAIHVTENGEPVSDVTVSGNGAGSANKFGLVLVIDASRSMRGAAIADAMKAARTFAAQRAPDQPLAVLVFNRTTHVLLPFTTDGSRIAAALRSVPALDAETHIYDAASAGLSLLTAAKIKSGTLVVLSDGSDTGSRVSLDSVTSQATAEGVRIFTVGLESKAFKPANLTSLADGAGGQYTGAASSGQLADIFNQLGAQLANQYLVHYQSGVKAGSAVSVQVAIDGYDRVPAFEYRAPALHSATGNVSRSLQEKWWTSIWAMLVVVALCAVTIGYALVTLLQPSRRAMRRRVTQYVSPDAIEGEGDEAGTVTAIAETLYDRTEHTLAGQPRWERFKEEVEISGIGLSAAQVMVLSVVAGVFAGVVLTVLIGTPLLLLVGLLGPVLAAAMVDSRAGRMRDQFAAQLPVNLEVLASALRAGHSLTGALKVVVEDAGEPSRTEFARIVRDEAAGMSLDDAFEETVRRMRNSDLRQIAIVSLIQREAGGNTAEVLDRVTENIRARFELRRMVKTLTAQGRMSRWIVTGLPAMLLVVIMLINPGYLDPLFHTTLGVLVFIASIVMVVAGSLFIKKIVQIEL